MEDSTVGPVLHFIRPERRTPSLGCIPVRLAELIMEASHIAIRLVAARASLEVFRAEGSMVEVFTAEAAAANSSFVPQVKKKDGGSYAKENQIR